MNGLVDQVANASPTPSSYLEEIGLDAWGVKQFADEVGVKFMLAFVREGKPRDTYRSDAPRPNGCDQRGGYEFRQSPRQCHKSG